MGHVCKNCATSKAWWIVAAAFAVADVALIWYTYQRYKSQKPPEYSIESEVNPKVEGEGEGDVKVRDGVKADEPGVDLEGAENLKVLEDTIAAYRIEGDARHLLDLKAEERKEEEDADSYVNISGEPGRQYPQLSRPPVSP